MRNIVNTYVERFLKERREQLRLIGIIAALAVLVVLGVFWRLHYTGVAMTNEVYCGQEEHMHDKSCYEAVLVCGLEESDPVEGHTHSDVCCETVTTLICGQDETPGHYHTEACYETIPAQLICGQEESPGHYHDAGCYDADGNLICGSDEYEGHTHTEACWSAEQRNLICGQDEYEGHTHTDACYQTDIVLVCGLEECEPVEGHTHTKDCYEKQLVCDLEEHTHTIECMTDENADLETAEVWEATLPAELTGIWAQDVVTVAQSQVGYEESTKNFVLDEDGETRKGYSRYGAWYGNEYGDWDAMFASFCLHYAGVPEDLMPEASGVYAWTFELAEKELYVNAKDENAAEEYIPTAGDLIFLDTDTTDEIEADHVGIIEKVVTDTDAETGEKTITKIKVIEGDCEDMVKENEYSPADDKIAGYGKLPEQPGIVTEAETETESETETEEETETETETEAPITGKSGQTGTVGGLVVGETETETEIETEIETETETETEIETETETETESETETETETEAEEIVYTAEDGGVTVSVTLPSTALPEEAELQVILQETEIETSDQEMEDGTPAEPEEAASFTFGMGTEEETASGELDLDIFFLADEEEVEPEEPAEVTIDASECLEEYAEEIETIEVWHMEETADGTEPVLVAEVLDAEEAASGTASFTVESFSEFEFHYTCSAGGWAGFGANLIDENGATISATVTGYDDLPINGRYTREVDMPYTFQIEDFEKNFDTKGSYAFLYATVTDPNYGDEGHTFDVWPDEEQVGANELYGSEENPVVSVTIDGTAANENPNDGNEAINSKTWHFTLTFADEETVTIPIYGNADGANDNGGKYCPKYLEINLYYESDSEVVLNLGNGNGTYSDGDYTGSNASGGDELRYGTEGLGDYADEDGKVTINLPSDNDLDAGFTVVDAIGSEGEDDYQPAVTIELGKEQAYDYKLIGWINIATGDYYDVSRGSTTAEIDLSDDNVFYADWIAASYDHGSSSDGNLREDIVSTNQFVEFHMFDYNELFDLYSVNLTQNGTESETWTDSGYLYGEPLLGRTDLLPIGKSFIFQNNGTIHSNVHVLSHANPEKWNLWTANSVWSGDPEYNFVLDAETYWGITSPSSTILGMLYDTSEQALGVHYVGDADYLFWVDENGYYTYDSAVSGAAYNQSEGRFYVYNDNANAFFPYNGHTDERTASNGTTNYWFGMNMEVNFYLPSATTGGTETNPVNQVDDKDMVFDFSGDDDIMIFVDGKLVSDMSGIHSTSYSRINFSTNTVSYSMGLDETGAPDTTGAGGKYSVDNNLDLSAGNHTMQIFYMERGASASNLKIQFNVAPVWEYKTGDVQTITAEKTWVDSKGNPIEDPSSLNSVYKSVEVGLFDVLGAATDDTYGYTRNGNTYTVTYTDDSGVARTYVYDNSGETPTLIYTEVDSNGNTVVNGEADDKTDSEGRVLDKDGYVVAWLEGENLYIRIDKQTLSDANGWYYAWELLDPDGTYEVLELSTSGSYTTSSKSENLTQYKYWSIIGDSEIENSFEVEGETLQVILTEAAQEASNTLGNTKDAMGWVIVATENGITTQQVKFSQIAELNEIKNSSGQTYYQTIAGVTSQSEIDALGPGAIWYVEDAKSTYADPSGAEFEDFYLYCYLNGTQYYLTLQGAEGNYSLTVTSTSSSASTFCYDSLGELLVIIGDTTERVEIQPDGEITIADAEREAAKDDIRIYTLQDTETSGFTFTAVNTFLPDFTLKKVDSVTEEALAGVSFTLQNADGLYYQSYDEKTDEVTWSEEQAVITTSNDEEAKGTYVFHYLPDGTYTLTETRALDGYNLLTSPITIVISEGKITSATISSDNDENDKYIKISEDGLTITVENSSGAELPMTGGPGTNIFTLAGLLLIISAAYLLYRNKKRNPTTM